MTKQLLHVHQGVIGDGGAVAALDALQDGPDIPWGDVGNRVEADHRVDFFLVDALGDVGVFQAPGQIGLMPVLEEVSDGADVGLDNFGPFLDWVGARSDALLGQHSGFPGVAQGHLRVLAQGNLVALALGAVAQHPVGRA